MYINGQQDINAIIRKSFEKKSNWKLCNPIECWIYEFEKKYNKLFKKYDHIFQNEKQHHNFLFMFF